jgi:hypothetical protein
MLTARIDVTRMLIFSERHPRSVLADYAGTATDDDPGSRQLRSPWRDESVADLFHEWTKRCPVLAASSTTTSEPLDAQVKVDVRVLAPHRQAADSAGGRPAPAGQVAGRREIAPKLVKCTRQLFVLWIPAPKRGPHDDVTGLGTPTDSFVTAFKPVLTSQPQQRPGRPSPAAPSRLPAPWRPSVPS